MTSIPPDVHDAAATGFAREADRYARGRPEYPEALSGWLRDTLGAGPGRTVVDVGAGTGKFTRLLADTGAQVVAVEPVAQMRGQLQARLPGVTALDGSAQALPLADASADAIVCAQAFHWFATPRVLASFHRVLRPGGRLGLVWNVRDESVEWVRAITALITPHEGDAPRFHHGRWRAPFAAGGFGPLTLTEFPHDHVGPAQDVVIDRFMSVSFIASLPPNERAAFEQRLRALVDGHPSLAGRRSITFPYRTQAFCAVRADAPPQVFPGD